ncbi:hypothetical protein ACIP01_11000 [Pseudomonas monteilii]|uniref:DUF7668 domain-containing protein n=1 Tax=Pseudomonas monteilii TaxID=76759 RepID=UPI0037F3102C
MAETISAIIEAFKEGDFSLSRGISGVHPIPNEDATGIEESIRDYGAKLACLPKETWDTSVCIWYGDNWEAMVDLHTLEEGASDLALHLKVREKAGSYSFEFCSVYVP